MISRQPLNRSRARARVRTSVGFEAMEGRLALSGAGGLLSHPHASPHAEIHKGGKGQGQDDPAGHNANDNHGALTSRPPGADDPAGHHSTPARHHGAAKHPIGHP